MNRERLQQMVVMLRGLPPEKRENFDMEDWNCGTTACAVGWACLDPVFIEQGLHLDYLRIAPQFEGGNGWYAVKHFFGVTFEQARYLFDINHYTKGCKTEPDEVADRIESFLKEAEVTA
jgi:hypothetical protein